MQHRGTCIVLVDLESTGLAVQDRMGALVDDVLFELVKGFCRRICTVQGTAEHFRVLARLDMIKSVLELEYLWAVGTLDAYLVNNIVQVSVLIFSPERLLALTAFGSALSQPLIDAILVEDLLTVAALDGSARDTQTNRADERVHEAAITFLNVLLAQAICTLKHEFNQMLVNAFNECLGVGPVVFFKLGNAKALR